LTVSGYFEQFDAPLAQIPCVVQLIGEFTPKFNIVSLVVLGDNGCRVEE
jgi:hypothetical protein